MTNILFMIKVIFINSKLWGMYNQYYNITFIIEYL